MAAVAQLFVGDLKAAVLAVLMAEVAVEVAAQALKLGIRAASMQHKMAAPVVAVALKSIRGD